MGATLSQREDHVTREQVAKWAGGLFDEERFAKLAAGGDGVPLDVFMAEARASKYGTKQSPSWSELAKVVCGRRSKTERALGKKVIAKLRQNLREIFSSDEGIDFVRLKASANIELQKGRVQQITIQREANESLGIVFRASSQLNVLGWSSRQYIVCDNFKKKPDGRPTCGLAAGLQQGDILITCEGVEIKSFAILKQQVSSSGSVLHWEVARPQEELLDEDIDISRRDVVEEIIREMIQKTRSLTKWQNCSQWQKRRITTLQKKIRERLAAGKSVRAKVYFGDISKIAPKQKVDTTPTQAKASEVGGKTRRRRRRRSRRMPTDEGAEEVGAHREDGQQLKRQRPKRRKKREKLLKEELEEQITEDFNKSATELLNSLMGEDDTTTTTKEDDKQKESVHDPVLDARAADVEAEIEALRSKAEYVEIMALIDGKKSPKRSPKRSKTRRRREQQEHKDTEATDVIASANSGDKTGADAPGPDTKGTDAREEEGAKRSADGRKSKRRARRSRKDATAKTEATVPSESGEQAATDAGETKKKRKLRRNKESRDLELRDEEAGELIASELNASDKTADDVAAAAPDNGWEQVAVQSEANEQESVEKESPSRAETKTEKRGRRKRRARKKREPAEAWEIQAEKDAGTPATEKDALADS